MSLKICDRCNGAREVVHDVLGITICSDCNGLGLIEEEVEGFRITAEEMNKLYQAKEAQTRQLHACDKKKQAYMLLCRFNTAGPDGPESGNKGLCMIDMRGGTMNFCIGQCLHGKNKIVKGVDNEWVLMR